MTGGCCLPTNWLGGVTWAFCCCLNHRKSACAGTDPTAKNVKKRPKRQALRPRNKCFIWWYWLSIKDLALYTQACIAYKCVRYFSAMQAMAAKQSLPATLHVVLRLGTVWLFHCRFITQSS